MTSAFARAPAGATPQPVPPSVTSLIDDVVAPAHGPTNVVDVLSSVIDPEPTTPDVEAAVAGKLIVTVFAVVPDPVTANEKFQMIVRPYRAYFEYVTVAVTVPDCVIVGVYDVQAPPSPIK